MIAIDREQLRKKYKIETGNNIFKSFAPANTNTDEIANYRMYRNYITWLEDQIEKLEEDKKDLRKILDHHD